MSDVERVGLLSDVHANLPALEAVLEDMPPVDALVHAGDVVGYGPWPDRCIQTLRDHDAHSVRGNHDEALFGGTVYESGDEYAKQTVGKENRAWLRDCPEAQTLFDGRLTVVHGHPDERFRYTYPADFAPSLLDNEDVLVLGHTHQQATEAFDDGIVVNPGSVGQPRDGDQRAAYAVADLTEPSVTLHRVAYDIDSVATATAETPIDARNARRLEEGR